MSSTTVKRERPTTGGATSEAVVRRVEVKATDVRADFAFTTEEEAVRAFDMLQTENFGRLERILATS